MGGSRISFLAIAGKHSATLRIHSLVVDDVLANTPTEHNKIGLFHLKAKAHDRSKEYDRAWEAAKNANAPRQLDYDTELHTEQVDMLMDIWSRENMDQFPVTTCQSVVPVFVAGTPRSGTSLIDQIIDAHLKLRAWGN